jgi:Domain of unknown function (DUF4291)
VFQKTLFELLFWICEFGSRGTPTQARDFTSFNVPTTAVRVKHGSRKEQSFDQKSAGSGVPRADCPSCPNLDGRVGVRFQLPLKEPSVLQTEPYLELSQVWPTQGRHVLAQFDADTVVVYQAYNPAIAGYVLDHGTFGGEFRYSRMSWIKTNFLWMMYRSGWGTKPDQEVTLAVRLRRPFFDSLLSAAVPSTWDHRLYATEMDWSRAVGRSDVRLQWDPDHHPSGAKLDRRAVQLGLRGGTLEAYGRRELVEVIDLSAFVAEQREVLAAGGVSKLVTPRERVYTPADPTVAARLGLDTPDAGTE